MQHLFIRTRTHELLTADFLNTIVDKYHYNRDDYALLEKVAFDILSCIRHKEALEVIFSKDHTYADIAYSLGPHVDALITRYEKEHQVLMQLMAEHITTDLLMAGYARIETDLNENASLSCSADFSPNASRLKIDALHFWGGEDRYPLSGLSDVITEFTHLSLSLTPEYYLIPSKSVVCRADISLQSEGDNQKESADCAPSLACKNCPKYQTDQCEFQSIS